MCSDPNFPKAHTFPFPFFSETLAMMLHFYLPRIGGGWFDARRWTRMAAMVARRWQCCDEEERPCTMHQGG
jgi:hypothetical protein